MASNDLPSWIRNDALAMEEYLQFMGEEYDDEPLPEMYLKPSNPEDYENYMDTAEQQLSDGLKVDEELYKNLDERGEWAAFVKFVKKFRREILGRGYETPQQCYYAYKHHSESMERNPDVEWKLPHIRTMTHPLLERIKYPLPTEPITDEFKAYVYYSLLDEPVTAYLDMINTTERQFQDFLEYCRFYQLWSLDWPTMCEVYYTMKTFKEIGHYREGQGPYEANHVVPIKEVYQTESEKQLEMADFEVARAAKLRRESLKFWAWDNRKLALEYLRARRHNEHDRRYDPSIPQFNMAPPKGMERIARNIQECEWDNRAGDEVWDC